LNKLISPNVKLTSAVSLIEIVIGTAMLAVVMLPVIMAFGAGSRGIELTRDEFTLHNTGLELMEQLLSVPPKLLPLGKFSDQDIQNKSPIGKSPLRFHISDVPGVSRQLEISPIPNTGKAKMKKIDILVILQKKNNTASQSLNLKTLIPYESK